LDQELDDWARLAVDAHFQGRSPWYSYHELFRDTGARLVGARPGEVVMMNSLTVNLHLMLATFYHPTPDRYRVLIDEPTFPSDLSPSTPQTRHHGYAPAAGLLALKPRDGEHTLRTEDIEEVLERRGYEIAVVLMSGVNFLTGQWFDLPRLTAA